VAKPYRGFESASLRHTVWNAEKLSCTPRKIARNGRNSADFLQHSYLRPRVEQPRKYPKIAKRVHRLKVGQHFDVPGVGTDERSRNRFRCGLYAAVGLDKVSVRGLPEGSVRVTKVGEWSSLRR